jgi:hypothetical protein
VAETIWSRSRAVPVSMYVLAWHANILYITAPLTTM